MTHLYGGIDEPEPKIIDVFICKLRRKLEVAGARGVSIDTVWGQGYILRETEAVSQTLAGLPDSIDDVEIDEPIVKPAPKRRAAMAGQQLSAS